MKSNTVLELVSFAVRIEHSKHLCCIFPCWAVEWMKSHRTKQYMVLLCEEKIEIFNSVVEKNDSTKHNAHPLLTHRDKNWKKGLLMMTLGQVYYYGTSLRKKKPRVRWTQCGQKMWCDRTQWISPSSLPCIIINRVFALCRKMIP